MKRAGTLPDKTAHCDIKPRINGARGAVTVAWLTTAVMLSASEVTGPLVSSTGMEAFKRLLDAPPVIEQLIYREKLPPQPNALIPMDVGVSRSTNYAVYEVRWQTNAMSVRTMELHLPVGRSDAYRTTFTMWNDNFWFLDNRTNAFVYHLEHERVRRGYVPPSYDAAWYRISRFGEVLNLGISHISPGSVRWDGNKFSVRGLADKQPMSVMGAISGLTNGIPCELTVRYSNAMAVVEYRLAYTYENYSPPGYPKRVSLFVKHGLKETEYRSYEILSVKTGSRSLPETHFDPDDLLQTKSMQLRFLTNDSIYLQLPTGKLLESRASMPNSRLTGADYYRNRYFYFSMSLVTVVFVRVFTRKKPN
jgi:hypothetical protein